MLRSSADLLKRLKGQVMQLSQRGRTVLQLISVAIRSGGIVADDPSTFLRYGEFHHQNELEKHGATWGLSFLNHGGLELAQWVQASDLPAVTGLVVDNETSMPGSAYFELYGRVPDDIEWWLSEVERALDLDWSVYLNDSTRIPFDFGMEYTRADIYRILDVPKESRGGDWDTGSHRHEDYWFVFANVGVAGRTGHDYENHWEGNRLVWHGRTGSRLDHAKSQSLIEPEAKVLIFTRNSDRSPFVFQGMAVADNAIDTEPVTVTWRFPDAARERPETIPEEVSGTLREGARQQILVNAYERNPEARRRCLEHHGVACCVCGFDFRLAYGELGNGYIHVHHLCELSDIGIEYEIDPIEDLRPVCPNCHAMLHRRRPCLSIDDLKQLFRPFD